MSSDNQVINLYHNFKRTKDHGNNYIKVKQHLVRDLLRNRLLKSYHTYQNCQYQAKQNILLSLMTKMAQIYPLRLREVNLPLLWHGSECNEFQLNTLFHSSYLEWLMHTLMP